MSCSFGSGKLLNGIAEDISTCTSFLGLWDYGELGKWSSDRSSLLDFSQSGAAWYCVKENYPISIRLPKRTFSKLEMLIPS
jgi:hypothetical protein